MLPWIWKYLERPVSDKRKNVFLATFEQRLKNEFIQKCFSDIRDSDGCRLYKDLRVCFTKLRLNGHIFLVEYARWLKVKVPYTQRTCTLCNSNDRADEYHVTLVCEYFRDARKNISSHSIIRDLI